MQRESSVEVCDGDVRHGETVCVLAGVQKRCAGEEKVTDLRIAAIDVEIVTIGYS